MRIVIFCTENLYSNIIVSHLLDKKDKEIVSVIKTSGVFHKKNFFQAVLLIFKKFSVSFFVFKTVETFLYFIFVNLNRFLVFRKNRLLPLSVLAKNNKINFFGTNDLNDPRFLSRLRKLEPELIVSVSANQKFSVELISIPKYGCINIHAGPLPCYKGIAPYFWALCDNKKKTGITIHFIDENLDSGNIIEKKEIDILPDDTMHSLFFRCCFSGKELLLSSINKIESGRVESFPQIGEGNYYSWPKPNDVRKFYSQRRKFWRFKEFMKSIYY